MNRSLLAACGGLALLGLAACTTSIERGGALYAEGRLVEAAEVFEHTEERLATAEAQERAEYGVFRGVTLLALGDARRGEQWLRYAEGVEREHPGALSPEARVELGRGLRELHGRRARRLAGSPATAGGRSEGVDRGPAPASSAGVTGGARHLAP